MGGTLVSLKKGDRHAARLVALVAAVVLGGCGGGRQDSSGPDPTTLSSLIPAAPAPSPTLSPTPPPDDEPLPEHPGGGRAGSAACGSPVPPPIGRVNVKVHSGALLDATPLVGPDTAYCAAIGYTDGRAFCPVRPDGHPEREACEALRVGRAADTGRIGPTWSANGQRCQGRGTAAPCENHPDNQYLAYALGAGTFQACAAGGACGRLTLP